MPPFVVPSLAEPKPAGSGFAADDGQERGDDDSSSGLCPTAMAMSFLGFPNSSAFVYSAAAVARPGEPSAAAPQPLAAVADAEIFVDVLPL